MNPDKVREGQFAAQRRAYEKVGLDWPPNLDGRNGRLKKVKSSKENPTQEATKPSDSDVSAPSSITTTDKGSPADQMVNGSFTSP